MNNDVKAVEDQPRPVPAVGRIRVAAFSFLRMALAVLVLGYLAMAASLYFAQDGMVFPSHIPGRIANPSPPPGTEVLKIEIAPGEFVEAWFTPAPGASAQSPAPLLVHLHGNAEVIDQHDQIVERFNRMGWSVLMPEYRGYGRSAGKPSQKAITQDATVFINQVLNRPDVDKNRVVYYGRSLGGGVACDVARQLPPTGLILCATFSSIVDMAWEMWMPWFIVRHPYRSHAFLKTYPGKVLIAHGVNDRRISIDHARKNTKASGHAQLIELDCEHNDFPGQNPAQARQFWEQVESFLQSTGHATQYQGEPEKGE